MSAAASRAPSFPPLFRGEAVAPKSDPFRAACRIAAAGTDPGLVLYAVTGDALRAAIVFAPEVPLREAVAVLPICGIGFQNAFGALAPPEVALHLQWDGTIRINGARCGMLRMAASIRDAEAEPDWLVCGLDLALASRTQNPGNDPGRTSLAEEGCGAIDPLSLIEAWTRHTLYWLNRWMEDGARPLYAEWLGLAHDVGKTIEIGGRSGVFTGLDERLGLLFETAGGTELIPLTALVERTA
ncbi:MAG: DUF4444 domain-containing protein [Nitratireductor sp.]|nr:DUF4444 domain-containing protein [Nitratireductor sp.]